jgi:cytochrome P450
MHRHPDLWERPEEFDPRTLLARAGAPAARATPTFPFGGGPRQCIGKAMALVEAQLVLATVAQRCRLRLASDRTVEPQALATLRPRGGLPMVPEPA